MNSNEFDKVVNKRLKLIESILQSKRAEYAPGGGDRLHNFKRASEMLRVTPEKALIGMWTKRIISILDIMDSIPEKIPSEELLEEKIGDAINYLILLEAMVKERIVLNHMADSGIKGSKAGEKLAEGIKSISQQPKHTYGHDRDGEHEK